jgi:2-keto-3-deoxy-L-rhamnonate aldolase RhmA
MENTPLKAMVRNRELKIGHYIGEFATPGIGHILKAAGCDFAFIDMEHSGFGFDTVRLALRYMEAGGIPATVRVPSKGYDHIARACDVGAEGIMLPMVGSPEEAREILACMKYYPEGRRGMALQIAHDRYRAGPMLEKLSSANKRTTMFALIETGEGAENADAIAALDGVDCLWIGHLDLSWSLGIPGEYDHPLYTQAVEKIRAACKRHNKSLGQLVTSVKQGVEFYEAGFDFICYSGDIWVFYGAVSEGISQLREKCEGKSAR